MMTARFGRCEISVYPYPRERMFSLLRFLMQIFPEFGIQKVDVSFGVLWGTDIFDWQEIPMDMNRLMHEIDRAESQHLGSIGSDDLYIRVPSDRLEIQLCHESDIHVRFDETTALVQSLVEYLSTSFREITAENISVPEPRVFGFEPRGFIEKREFINDDVVARVIELEPWGQAVNCPPNTTCEILAHGSQPGRLEFSQSNAGFAVKGWPSSRITVSILIRNGPKKVIHKTQ